MCPLQGQGVVTAQPSESEGQVPTSWAPMGGTTHFRHPTHWPHNGRVCEAASSVFKTDGVLGFIVTYPNTTIPLQPQGYCSS